MMLRTAMTIGVAALALGCAGTGSASPAAPDPIVTPELAEELRDVRVWIHQSPTGVVAEIPRHHKYDNPVSFEKQLAALVKIPALDRLEVHMSGRDVDLRGIERLETLRSLDVWWSTAAVDLEPVSRLSALEGLTIHGAKGVDLSPLASLPKLERVVQDQSDASGWGRLRNLRHLEGHGVHLWRGRQGPAEVRLDSPSEAALRELAQVPDLESVEIHTRRGDPLPNLGDLGSVRRLVVRAATVDPGEIASLVSLRELDLDNTDITDLSFLTGMAELRFLSLGWTPVWDLGPLAQMSELTDVVLNRTRVRDIAPLARLPRLERLDLRGAPVPDVSALSSMPSLRRVDLRGTHVSTIQADALRETLPNACVVGPHTANVMEEAS